MDKISSRFDERYINGWYRRFNYWSNGEENIDIIGNLYLKYDSELKNSLQQFCKKILTQ